MVLEMTPSIAARIDKLTENEYFPYLKDDLARGAELTEEDLEKMEWLKAALEEADEDEREGRVRELTPQVVQEIRQRALENWRNGKPIRDAVRP
jgi:hypothetical protein